MSPLYLHCGWPKTSTTSLQNALFEHRDELAATGTTYPERWLSEISPTHHGLVEMLKASLESERAFDEFRRFLEARADQDVLFSAEVLAGWLAPGEKLDAFMELLRVAGAVMPTKCIWTLRRRDEIVRSVYLVNLKLRARSFRWPINLDDGAMMDDRFAGHRAVEEEFDGEIVYVQYDPAGTHNARLLDAFGIDRQVADLIASSLERGPRLRTSPTHKQFVVLTNFEALSRRAGVSLDETAVRRAFRQGFEFEQDWACEWTDPEWQKTAHEEALEAARRHGVTAYVEFFEDVELEFVEEAELNGSASSGQDTNAITGDDLRRLTEVSAQQR